MLPAIGAGVLTVPRTQIQRVLLCPQAFTAVAQMLYPDVVDNIPNSTDTELVAEE